MGAVYRAEHTSLKRIVALKLLPQELTNNPEAILRFRREMEAVGRLHHPNIIQAHDAGEDGGQCYLAMELVDGFDLSRLVQRVGPISAPDACEMVRQAASGLKHACEHGLVHRDIKPSNLMLTRDGQVKILDFGLSRLDSDGVPAVDLTVSGQMLGTFHYMAPEQCADVHHVDIRADLYSLGCSLYFLLTGKPPYGNLNRQNMLKVVQAHASEPVPALPPDLLPAPMEQLRLSQIVSTLMAKDPDDRLAAPEDLIEELTPICDHSDLAAVWERGEQGNSGAEGLAGDESTASQRGPVTVRQSAAAAPHTHAARTQTVWSPARWLFLGVIAAITFGLVLFLRDGQGTVEIEVTGPDVEIIIDDETRSDFEVVTRDGRVFVRVVVHEGRHTLEVKQGGLTSYTDDFQIVDDDVTVVAARFTPRERTERPGFDNDHSAERNATEAREQLDVIAEVIDAGVDADPTTETNRDLRRQLVDIRRVHYASPAALEAARLMRQLPWPVDTLKHEDISEYEREVAADGAAVDAFTKIVGILGNSRLKHWRTVTCIDFAPDGLLLASGGSDKAVRLWEVSTREQLRFIDHAAPVNDVAVGLREGLVASCDSSGLIIVYSQTDGDTLIELQRDTSVTKICWIADGTVLLSADLSGTVCFWDLQSKQPTQTIPTGLGGITALAASTDERFICTGHRNGMTQIWDRRSGDSVRALDGHAEQVYSLAFSPDGNRILSGSKDGTLRLWETASGDQQILHQRNNGSPIDSVAFSPDGRFAGSSDGGHVGLWDTASGDRVASMNVDSYGVTAFTFSNDGSWFATAGPSCAIRIWDAKTVVDVTGIDSHHSATTGVDVSASETHGLRPCDPERLCRSGVN